jgi:hypothetical protein
MGAFVDDQGDASRLVARARELGLEGHALQEYWRGVGRAMVYWRMSDEGRVDSLAASAPLDVREALWQGIGMQAHVSEAEHQTEDLDRFVPVTSPQRAAYAWGWARVCTDDGHVPALVPALPIDRRLGRRLRWDLDLAKPGAPALSDEDLERVIFKQWWP